MSTTTILDLITAPGERHVTLVRTGDAWLIQTEAGTTTTGCRWQAFEALHDAATRLCCTLRQEEAQVGNAIVEIIHTGKDPHRKPALLAERRRLQEAAKECSVYAEAAHREHWVTYGAEHTSDEDLLTAIGDIAGLQRISDLADEIREGYGTDATRARLVSAVSSAGVFERVWLRKHGVLDGTGINATHLRVGGTTYPTWS